MYPEREEAERFVNTMRIDHIVNMAVTTCKINLDPSKLEDARALYERLKRVSDGIKDAMEEVEIDIADMVNGRKSRDMTN